MDEKGQTANSSKIHATILGVW